MKAERLVVDTNVLISALLVPTGTPRRLLERLAMDAAVLLFSDLTFAELATRLGKPKFNRYRTAQQLDDFLSWLMELGEWINPELTVAACRDPDDNKFLALAITGEASALITGDRDLLELDPFEGVSILTTADFLRRQAGP